MLTDLCTGEVCPVPEGSLTLQLKTWLSSLERYLVTLCYDLRYYLAMLS